MAKTVAGAAGGGRLAMLFAPTLHLEAAAALAHRLEVPEAATSDYRPAVKNGERYGCPYHCRSVMAADKSSWSDIEHDRITIEAKEMLTA